MSNEEDKQKTELWGFSPHDPRVQAEISRRLHTMTIEELRATFGTQADAEAMATWDADHKVTDDVPKDDVVDPPTTGN